MYVILKQPMTYFRQYKTLDSTCISQSLLLASYGDRSSKKSLTVMLKPEYHL